MLVIADANKPVAVAGVMGGFDSEVAAGTTTILLEAANFNPISVRRTSGALGLRHGSVDAVREGPASRAGRDRSPARHEARWSKITGGRAAKGLVDTYPASERTRASSSPASASSRCLASTCRRPQVRAALTDLGFGCRVGCRRTATSCARRTGAPTSCRQTTSSKSWRASRLRQARGAGRSPAPSRRRTDEPVRELRERIRDAAVAAGLQEIITYPLTSPRPCSRSPRPRRSRSIRR